MNYDYYLGNYLDIVKVEPIRLTDTQYSVWVTDRFGNSCLLDDKARTKPYFVDTEEEAEFFCLEMSKALKILREIEIKKTIDNL